MDPITIGAIMQGVQTGGNMLTNMFNLFNQERNNRIMREREDTAVQRRAKDLAKAGINPMLAGLGGATAQLGGLVPMTSPDMNTLGNVTQQISKSEANIAEATKDRETIEYMKTEKRLLISQIEQNSLINDRIKEETKFIVANTQNTQSNTLTNKFQRDLMKAQTANTYADKQLKTAQTILAMNTVNKIKAEIEKLGSDVRLNFYKEGELYEKAKNIAQDTILKEKEGKLKQKDIEWYNYKMTLQGIGASSNALGNLAKFLPY